MSRIVKIALNMKEDLIAAVIVARYHFYLDDSMVNYAVADKQFLFLQYNFKKFNITYSNVFYYDKNIIIDYVEKEGEDP